jgi:hypothetical protein
MVEPNGCKWDFLWGGGWGMRVLLCEVYKELVLFHGLFCLSIITLKQG